jgi:hypothetical protein
MCDDFFGSSQTVNDVVKYVPSHVTTVVKRSNGKYCSAYSRLCVNIDGTATVLVQSNPFGVPAMDLTLSTITVSGEYLIVYGAVIVLDVTAVNGTVTAILVCGDD